MWYTLKDKVPVEATAKEYSKWRKKNNRHVLDDEGNGIRVSTVFLGQGCAYGGCEPVLFETMIFGGKFDKERRRYTTWEEAEAGHKKSLKLTGLNHENT